MKRGQRGIYDLAQKEIVEADERNLVGNFASEPVRSLKKADRGQIVGTDYGTWGVRHGEEALRRISSTREPMISLKEPFVAKVQSTGLHRRKKSFLAPDSRAKGGRTRNESNLPVAEHLQMLDCIDKAADIIDCDGSEFIDDGGLIKEDDRHLREADAFDGGGTYLRGENRQSVNSALQKALHAGEQPLFAIASVRYGDVDSVFGRQRFEVLDEVGKEGVPNIGDDDAIEIASA